MELTVEKDVIWFREDDKNTIGIGLSTLSGSQTSILEGFDKIKQILSDRDIKALLSRKIEGISIHTDFLELCHAYNELKNNDVEGADNLIKSINRRKNRDEILSDLFVAKVAADYSSKYQVMIKVKKKEIGTDLIINGLKCDCKIRMGYLDTTNKDFIFESPLQTKSLKELAGKELVRTLKSPVMIGLLKQKAEVIFIDISRTTLGFSQIAAQNNNIVDKPPEIKKYSIILFFHENEKKRWITTILDDKIIEPLIQKYKSTIQNKTI